MWAKLKASISNKSGDLSIPMAILGGVVGNLLNLTHLGRGDLCKELPPPTCPVYMCMGQFLDEN